VQSVTSKEVKEYASGVGFSLVGILDLEQLRALPVGDVAGLKTLVSAEKELPTVRSGIVLGYRIWDSVFNIHTLDPRWRGAGLHPVDDRFEFHQLYSEVIGFKAWRVAAWLKDNGFDAVPSNGMPLKRAASLAGLGKQGKNTLFVSSLYGPRVRLGAILTSAELESDRITVSDMCVNCDRCIRACPTKALKPYDLTIRRCMVYATENPESSDVDPDVRALSDKLTIRPTKGSFIECTICQDACPVGRDAPQV
jgi:ferredoxin